MRLLYVAPSRGSQRGLAAYANAFEDALSAADISFRRLAVSRGFPSKQDILVLDKKLKPLLQSSSFDIAHVELTSPYGYSFVVAEMIADSTMPLVLTIHQPVGIVGRGRDSFAYSRIKQLLQKASVLITLSPAGKGKLVSRWGVPSSACKVIPHVRFGSPGHVVKKIPTKILFCGYDEPYKGLDLLLDAFALLSSQNDGVPKLHIAGGEDAEAKPAGLIQAMKEKGVPSESVVWHTGKSEKALQSLIASVDSVVLPYKDDPNSASGILIRALSAGTPVICSDVPALTYYISPNQGALVFKKYQVTDLSDKLEKLTSSVKLRRNLSASALRAAANLSPHLIGNLIFNLYQTISKASEQ